jgi:hypothetical protein
MVVLMQVLGLAAIAETKEGSCQLQQRKGFDQDAFTVQVGEKIKGTCRFCIDDFLGKKIIGACIKIDNTSDSPMHCQYYVAFFDAAGTLIGCAGQGTFGGHGLAPSESTQLGSCLIPLPAGLHEKAVQYKIAFYESDKEIGRGQSGAGDRAAATKRLPTGSRGDAHRQSVTGSGITGRPSRSVSAGRGDADRWQTEWYSAGPGWKELNQLAEARGIALHSGNHDAGFYQRMLSQSQPGSTLVLLFALDHTDKNVPDQYKDLLPMPWNQIEAKLTSGETVVATGKSRERRIVLLAAPTESVLKTLIHNYGRPATAIAK